MQVKSINRYHSFCRSLENLSDAVYEDAENKFVLSGTVQMYNLSFDLSWKVMKDLITSYHGVTDFAAGSPRETLQTAKSVGLIDSDIWIQMLRARNHLAHDYDGALARKYFSVIISDYLAAMEIFRKHAAPYFEEIS